MFSNLFCYYCLGYIIICLGYIIKCQKSIFWIEKTYAKHCLHCNNALFCSALKIAWTWSFPRLLNYKVFFIQAKFYITKYGRKIVLPIFWLLVLRNFPPQAKTQCQEYKAKTMSFERPFLIKTKYFWQNVYKPIGKTIMKSQ